MLRAPLVLLLAALASSPRSTFVVPNFWDLTIKTRTTHGLMMPTVTTWYFKGARQRTEHNPQLARLPQPFSSLIFQCDQRTEIMLHMRDKTYRSFTMHSGEISAEHRPQVRNPDGPDVTITVESVDTGERQQIAGYQASHFKSTITVDPSKGASRKAAKTEIDGWYLDLPGLDCRESSPRENLIPGAGAGMFELGFTAGGHDHMILKRAGTMPHGLPISQTATERAEGNVIVSKIELLESTEAPLDDALFEIPADYSPAPTPEVRQVLRIAPPTPAQ